MVDRRRLIAEVSIEDNTGQGAQSARRSLAALGQTANESAVAVEQVNRVQAGAREEYERLARSLDPVAQANTRYAEGLRTIERAQRQGVVSATEASRVRDLLQEKTQEAAGSSEKLAKSTGKVADASRKAASATAELAIENTEIKQQFDELNFAARSLAKTVGLLAAGYASFQLAVAGGRDKAKQFETALAEVKTVLADKSEIDALGESLKGISTDFGSLPAEQARAAYEIISAGAENAAQATTTLTASNVLATAGLADLTQSSKTVSGVLNAYSRSAQDATDVTDTLFVGVRQGQTTIRDLGQEIGRVTTLAATLGVPFQEVVAAIAAITKGGVATNEAVTGLVQVFSNVLKPSEQAKEAATALGLEFDSLALRSQGLSGFLQNVSDKAGGSDAVMASLFGSVQGLTQVFTLTGSQADAFALALDAMEDRAGAANEAFRDIADTTEFVERRLQATRTVLSITLGEGSLPALRELKLQLANLFDQRDVRDFARQLGRLVGTGFRVLANILDVVNDNFRLFLTLVELLAISRLTRVFSRLAAAIGAVGGTLAGVGGLVTRFVPILRNLSFGAIASRAALVSLGAAVSGVGLALGLLLAPINTAVAGLVVLFNFRDDIAEWIAAIEDAEIAWRAIGDVLERNILDQLINIVLVTQQIAKSLAPEGGTLDSISKTINNAVAAFEVTQGVNIPFLGLNQGKPFEEAIDPLGFFEAVRKRAQELKAELDGIENSLDGVIGSLSRNREGSLSVGKFADEIAKLRVDTANIEFLTTKVAEGERVFETYALAIDVVDGNFKNLTRSVVDAASANVDAQRALQRAQAQFQLDRDAEFALELSAALSQSFEQYELIIEAQDAVRSGLFETTEEALEFARASQLAREEFQRIDETAAALEQLAIDPLEEFGRNGQQFIVDFWNDFRDRGFDVFGDLGDQLENFGKRLVNDIFATNVLRPILQPLIGAFGNVAAGGGLGSLFGGGGGVISAGTNVAAIGTAGTAALGAGSFTGGGLTGFLDIFNTGGVAGRGGLFGRAPQGPTINGDPLAPGFFDAGGTLSGLISGAGQGFLGGSLLDAFGVGRSNTGSQIGSAIGGIAGSAFGPIGSIIGGGLGKLVGGLFGGKPSNNSAGGFIFSDDLSRPQLLAQKNNVNVAARDAILAEALRQLREFERVTGGDFLRTSVNVDVGSRDGIRINQGGRNLTTVNTSEQAVEELTSTILKAFVSDNSEVQTLVRDMNAAGRSLDEIASAAVFAQEALNQTTDAVTETGSKLRRFKEELKSLGVEGLDTKVFNQLRVEFDDEIRRAILNIQDPFALALEDFDQVAAQRLATAEELAANIAQVEMLNALERQAIIERFADQANDALAGTLDDAVSAFRDAQLNARSFYENLIDPLQSLQNQIVFGNAGVAGPAAQLSFAEGQFQEVAAAALRGELNAIEDLPSIGQQFLDVARQNFNSGPQFFEIANRINETLSTVLSDVEVQRNTVFENFGIELSDTINDQTTDLLAELRNLRQAVDRQTAVLETAQGTN